MSKPNLKEIITDVVLKQLPNVGNQFWTHHDAMRMWWVNIRRQGGLRLTVLGINVFALADIEFYQYPFTLPKTSKSYYQWLLELENKLKCPYYIGFFINNEKTKEPFIRLYDSRIAMMVGLYGDVFEYLKSVHRNK